MLVAILEPSKERLVHCCTRKSTYRAINRALTTGDHPLIALQAQFPAVILPDRLSNDSATGASLAYSEIALGLDTSYTKAAGHCFSFLRFDLSPLFLVGAVPRWICLDTSRRSGGMYDKRCCTSQLRSRLRQAHTKANGTVCFAHRGCAGRRLSLLDLGTTKRLLFCSPSSFFITLRLSRTHIHTRYSSKLFATAPHRFRRRSLGRHCQADRLRQRGAQLAGRQLPRVHHLAQGDRRRAR